MTKNILQNIGLPLVFLGVFASLFLLWRILNLPKDDELIEIIRNWFNQYGLWIVLVSAIIEGVLLVGWYYPGSLVIFLGVIFAGKDIPQVIITISFVTIGLLVAYILNYAIGRYGWYKLLLKFGIKAPVENAKRRLTKYGLKGIYGSYWQPNLAALTSTAAGILHFPFKKFLKYSLIATIIWNVFWGSLVYFLGESALNLVANIYIVFIGIGVWIAIRLIRKPKSIEDKSILP